ncbi:MAG: cysteine--tRNA ligase, partial [Planctomycetes bacterium]|nr:cysteine--tRNA ligase [Planctomycetota bacterium]
QKANKLAGSKGAASVKELFKEHAPETVRFFLLSTHYRSPIELSEEFIAETGKSLDGFYRLFEMSERITGRDFYSLPTSESREQSAPLAGEPSEFYTELKAFRDRFLNSMDDDFNTGGAIGVLFEMRKGINGFISQQKLDADGRKEESSLTALTTAMTMLKELSNLLGVFRTAVAKPDGADDVFAAELMTLLIDIRAEARSSKHFAIADKIRDGLTELKVVLEDRPDGTGWRRE